MEVQIWILIVVVSYLAYVGTHITKQLAETNAKLERIITRMYKKPDESLE